MRAFAYLIHILQPRNWSAAVLVVFAVFLASGVPGYAESNHAGKWITNYGKLRIYDSGNNLITGSYSYQGFPAQIYAEEKHQNVFEGVWIQQNSEITCNEAARGSSHWGRVRILFTGYKFFALWNYCDRALVRQPNRLWEGILKARNNGDEEVLIDRSNRPPRLKTSEIFEKLVANSDRTERDILQALKSRIIK